MTELLVECDQFPGRLKDLCTGEGLDGRPAPKRTAVDAFRAERNLPPLAVVHNNANVAPAVKDHAKQCPIPKAGVGSHLKAIFATLGVSIPGCEGCQGTMSRMNKLGPEGCRTHLDSFVNEIANRAKDVSWLDKATAGWHALTNGLPLTIAGLVEEAIRRAESEQ